MGRWNCGFARVVLSQVGTHVSTSINSLQRRLFNTNLPRSSQESIARLRSHFGSSHFGLKFALGIGLCQTYPPRSLPWQLPIAWPIWRSSRTWTTSCKSPSPWLRNCRIRESLKLSQSSPSRSDRRPPRRPTRKLPRKPRSRMRQKQPRHRTSEQHQFLGLRPVHQCRRTRGGNM